MANTTSGPGPRPTAVRPGRRRLRTLPASLQAGRDRRAARAARTVLARELASYTSPADLTDLDAMLSRHSEEETAEIRRILAACQAG
jgi:hypothetical protein